MKRHFNLLPNRIFFIQQEADRATKRAAEKEKENKELREKLKEFNALSRRRKK